MLPRQHPRVRKYAPVLPSSQALYLPLLNSNFCRIAKFHVRIQEGHLLRYASSATSSRTEVRSGIAFVASLVSAPSEFKFLPNRQISCKDSGGASAALCFLGNILAYGSTLRYCLRRKPCICPFLENWRFQSGDARHTRVSFVRERFRIPHVTPQMPLGIANFGDLKRI